MKFTIAIATLLAVSSGHRLTQLTSNKDDDTVAEAKQKWAQMQAQMD